MNLASQILQVAHDAPPHIVAALRHHGKVTAAYTGATPATIVIPIAELKRLPVDDAVISIAYLPASMLDEVFKRDKRKSVRTAVLERPDLPASLAADVVAWVFSEDGVSNPYDRARVLTSAISNLTLTDICRLPVAAWQNGEVVADRVVACITDEMTLDATLATIAALGPNAVALLLSAGISADGPLGPEAYLARVTDITLVLRRLRQVPVSLVEAVCDREDFIDAVLHHSPGSHWDRVATRYLHAEIVKDGPRWYPAFRLLAAHQRNHSELTSRLSERQIALLTTKELLPLGLVGASLPEIRIRRILAEFEEWVGLLQIRALTEAVLLCRDTALVAEYLTAVTTHLDSESLTAVATLVFSLSRSNWPELVADPEVRHALKSAVTTPIQRLELLGPDDSAEFAAMIIKLAAPGAFGSYGAAESSVVFNAINTIPLEHIASLLTLLSLLPSDGHWLNRWSPTGANPKTDQALARWLAIAPERQTSALLEALGGWAGTGGLSDRRLFTDEKFARQVINNGPSGLENETLLAACRANPNIAALVLNDARHSDLRSELRSLIVPDSITVRSLLSSYVADPPCTEDEWVYLDAALDVALATFSACTDELRDLLRAVPLDDIRLHRVLTTNGRSGNGKPLIGPFQTMWARGAFTANPYRREVLAKILADGELCDTPEQMAIQLLELPAGRELLSESRQLLDSARTRIGVGLGSARAVYELLTELLGDNAMAWEQALGLADDWTDTVAMLATVALAATA